MVAVLLFSPLGDCRYTARAENRAPSARLEPRLKFERISIDQGLSANSVYSTYQDSKGFMWVGTLDGLDRYDGYEITVFKNDPMDAASLSNNTVRSVWSDRRGTLWVGTNAGLNRFDPSTGGFVRYLHDPNDPASLSGDFVHAIFDDSSGTLWVGTDTGLNRFDRATGGFTHYVHDPNNPESLTAGAVHAILEDRSGNLWIGTEGGLNQHRAQRGSFRRYVHDRNDRHSLSNNNVRSLYEDRSGALWIATLGGLNRRVPDTGRFQRFLHDPTDPYSLGHDVVASVYEDGSGRLWIGTDGGLNRFDRETGRFARFRHEPSDPYSLSDNQIVTLYEDRSGILWVGTWNGGVNKLAGRQERFHHVFHDPADPRSLSSNVVKSIHEDRLGTLWVGTTRGLNRWDRATGRFTRYPHDPENPNSLSHNDVWSVYEDREGTLWVGTAGGLNRFDREAETFTHFAPYAKDPRNLAYNAVVTIYQDRAGTLWVGTIAGLTTFDRDGRRFTSRFTQEPGDPQTLSNNFVSLIYEDRTGRLWVGTTKGLNRFDRVRERFTRYLHDPSNPRSLSANMVTAIHESNDGKKTSLWIGTESGLNRFDPESQDFTRYTERDGLPNAFICGILEDRRGRLWLSTNRGLSRFDPRVATFRNYDVNDGLQSNEFNLLAYHQGRDGTMFFGGSNGFNAFHPDRIKDNLYIPPIVLTDFQIFNRSVTPSDGYSPLKRAIFETEDMALSYRQSVFSLAFAALDYTAPRKNQYAYKMEGFDPDWNYVGTRRFATYTNLDPGQYVFRVKGSNNDGVWNEEGVRLKITITSPPWKTWWAYSLYIVFTLAALYGIRRYELNRIHLKNRLKWERLESEKLRELDSLKSRFFANVSHEFRTPLSLILGPVERLSEEAEDEKTKERLQLVRRNARRLERLVNQLLDLSRLESGKMRLRVGSGNIVEFLKTITLFFAPLAEGKGIRLAFRASQEEIPVYFDGDKVDKIFTNLLSNALKFTGEGGAIEVSVESRPRGLRPESDGSGRAEDGDQAEARPCVEIGVSDTGVGIPAEQLPHVFERFYQVDDSLTRDQEGSGIGLALAKELVELHHGTIDAMSEEGQGTTFVVRLPLGKDLFTSDEILPVATRTGISPAAPNEVGELEPGEAVHEETPHEIGPAEDDTIVLIVEDHAEVRAYLRECLEPRYKVLQAKDGAEGLARAREAIPDLVISDVMMPVMNGQELCRELKTDERTSHIPVILLTAKAGSEDRLEGLGTGADDYVSKPFDTKELLLRSKNLIELRRTLRRRFSQSIVLRPSEMAVSSMDEVFLGRVLAAVETHMEDGSFSVEELGQEVGMSRSQLHRKLRALTNQAPTALIRGMRLERAAQLLRQRAGSVGEIAYRVGFGSQAHFTKCFHDRFGCTPGEFIRRSAT